MADTANLSLPLMEAAQSQKHVTHNEALLILDAVVQLSVIDDDLTAPPGGAADGDRYIVGSGATGAWDDKDLNIAVRLDGAWTFLVPKDGWMCWVEDSGSLFIWVTSAWVDFGAASGLVGGSSLEDGSILELGINTAPDTTNRLAVKSDAVLFSHDNVTPGTGDMRITVNKSAAGKDAAFTFQDGFSTRALFGLLGNDDFSVSVSPDGSTFYSAMAIDKDTGNVAIGAGSDANNRLLVSGSNMLFTSSGDLSFTFNKGATGDDCSLTFQDGFSARALVGLLGDDNFTFKVSPDGSNYFSGMLIDRTNGQVSLPAAPKCEMSMNFDKYMAANTWTKVQFNTANHNDQSAFDTTNNRFVAPAAGYYMIGYQFTFKANSTVPTVMYGGVYKNGTELTYLRQQTDHVVVDQKTTHQCTSVVKLAANDYIEIWGHMAGFDGYVATGGSLFYAAKIA